MDVGGLGFRVSTRRVCVKLHIIFSPKARISAISMVN